MWTLGTLCTLPSLSKKPPFTRFSDGLAEKCHAITITDRPDPTTVLACVGVMRTQGLGDCARHLEQVPAISIG